MRLDEEQPLCSPRFNILSRRINEYHCHHYTLSGYVNLNYGELAKHNA